MMCVTWRLFPDRLWGMMSAVAKLKQAVKSATEVHDTQQRFDAQQQHQQQQQQPQQLKKTPAPSTGTFHPCMIGNSWDFHPLLGGLMDAVMMLLLLLSGSGRRFNTIQVMGRLQQMGDTQTGGSIAGTIPIFPWTVGISQSFAALGLCNRSENGRSSELAGEALELNCFSV
jgi:hypothetical protein